MSKKEEFKNFIINKPELIDYALSNKTTWQKLFEIYDLYGEKNEIWENIVENKTSSNSIDLKNIINVIKNIDLDSLEDNIGRVEKIVGLVSEFTKKDEEVKEIKAKEEKIDNLYGDENEN